MCGIVGGVSFTGAPFIDRADLTKAADFLRHRGPDDSGEVVLNYESGQMAFAHRRLSIIDLSVKARQPMISASGKTWIVFNGEIYNYRLLRNELDKKGFVFNNLSDTEVILNAFEYWGFEGTLKRLDGMFAFALFDLEARRLFLARDRFGKKPLYYFSAHGQLVFSSDIRSFKAFKFIPRSIDMHGLGYFFSELSTPLERTIWSRIQKLKPGWCMTFSDQGMEAYHPYVDMRFTERCQLQRADILIRTESLLSEAVKKRLVGDVEIAALLSGGIDSSLIVAKMASHSSRPVKTYSVGFEEDDFNELHYARYVARKFGTDHTELVLRPDSLLKASELIGEFGEPFGDASMLPTYWISKAVGRNQKVVLGGDGGDELFGGYHSYYFARKFDHFKRFHVFLPLAKLAHRANPSYRTTLLKDVLEQARNPNYELLWRKMAFSPDELKMLSNEEAFYNALANEHRAIWEAFTPGSENDVINVMEASLKTRLVNDYLVKVDRATMYASLEMRTPFLDKDLFEFTSTLPPAQLFYRDDPKSILKDIATKYFSHEFAYRNKMGFSAPVGDWFRGRYAGHLKEVVLGGRQKLVDLNYHFIEEVIERHCDGSADYSNKLWTLFVFHIWANQS